MRLRIMCRRNNQLAVVCWNTRRELLSRHHFDGSVEKIQIKLNSPQSIVEVTSIEVLHIGVSKNFWKRALPAQPLLHLWRVFLDPAVDGGMVNTYAALAHHLLKIAVADPVTAISTHRQLRSPRLENDGYAAPLQGASTGKAVQVNDFIWGGCRKSARSKAENART
jgi:hypothetical protein